MKIIGFILIDNPFVAAPWFESHQMEIVDVAPHLASVATFAVYKNSVYWVVANLETGSHVDFAKTRGEALINATKSMSSKTEEDIERAYAKFPQKLK